MLRICENILCVSVFDDLAVVHNGNFFAYAAHDAQVVGDEEQRNAALFVEPPEHVENLGLHRHVEGGGRLVEDEKLRVVDEGRRDHRALALTAGELMRIFFVGEVRLGQTDKTHDLERHAAALLGLELEVQANGLLDLVADAHERVEARHRLLKDDADVLALDETHFAAGAVEQIAPVEDDLAVDLRAVVFQKAGDGHGGDGLAAAGLADEAEGLPVLHMQIDTADRLRRMIVVEGDR